MQWIFQRIIERLVLKLISMMGSEWDARVELHLSETRAELLRRAKQFESEETLGLDEVAASLRAQAEALGKKGEAPSDDVVRVAISLKDENLREPDSLKAPDAVPEETKEVSGGLLPAPEKKKRGRPRKHPRPEEEIEDE